MNEVSYQRPREKMQQRGAASLNTTELLQVIIGSGVKGHSVAKLAREVRRCIDTKGLQLRRQDLISVKGLGDAKVGVLLAIVELSRRLSDSRLTRPEGAVLEDLRAVAARTRKSLRYCLLDGAGAVIIGEDYTISPSEHYGKVVRRVFSHALASGAHSVSLAIGCKSQGMTPSAYDLGVVAAALETAKALQMHVHQAVLVNPMTQVSLLKDVRL